MEGVGLVPNIPENNLMFINHCKWVTFYISWTLDTAQDVRRLNEWKFQNTATLLSCHDHWMDMCGDGEII